MKLITRVVASLLIALLTAQLPLQGQTFTQEVATVYTPDHGLPKQKITRIALVGHTPLAADDHTVYELVDEQWKASTKTLPAKAILPLTTLNGVKVLSSVNYQKSVVFGTAEGLYQKTGTKVERLFPVNEKYYWALRNVAVVLVDSKGRLWFAAEEGVGYLEDNTWKLFTGKEGLPYNQFTCGAADANGGVWFGTTKGAIKFEGEEIKYRANRRWLADDHVNQIALDKDGTAWIATNAGVSSIKPVAMTFAQKADYFTKQVEERHNRDGFIAHNVLKKRFDPKQWSAAISDNDGMYTAKYGAAQAFRYAATGDLEAKALAERSFKACKWLVDITHEPGFPARVIIPIDWHENVNEQYSREFNKKVQERDPLWKDIFPRFPKSKDGKFMWKCDASSDELAGHFFFYSIYYDLVAKTPEEKKEVAEVVSAMTDHLIRHGYKLVDHDGKVTRWGDFSPEYFHSPYGYDQRGLNAMMMLSFLNVAKQVTGDSKYDREADKLRKQHNYHIFALHPKEYFPAENVVPWDNNLCLMSLYILIKNEKDPALLLMYRQALENAWLHVSKQRNPFWDAIYLSLANDFTQQVDQKYFENKSLFAENRLYAPSVINGHYKASTDATHMVKNLEKIPLDLIGYFMDNTHRLDVVIDPTPGQSPTMGWRVDGNALPVDERAHVRQDRDGFALKDSEGDGWSEHEGTFYLLPYYMATYHKLMKP